MGERTRILVVDDDPAIQTMYRERLALAGFDVIVASNAEEGMARAVDAAPAVILLDIRLPSTNGLDMLDILKTTNATANIPIILLTALSGPEVRERGLAHGAADFLLKSETMPGDVVKKIQAVLQKQKEQPQ